MAIRRLRFPSKNALPRRHNVVWIEPLFGRIKPIPLRLEMLTPILLCHRHRINGIALATQGDNGIAQLSIDGKRRINRGSIGCRSQQGEAKERVPRGDAQKGGLE